MTAFEPPSETSRIHLPDLRGKTALVTGASRGIGRAVVEALVAHDVHCFALANGGFEPDLPAHVTPITCDLSHVSAVQEAVDTVSARAPSLDYLVNVVGIDPKHRLVLDGIPRPDISHARHMVLQCKGIRDLES